MSAAVKIVAPNSIESFFSTFLHHLFAQDQRLCLRATHNENEKWKWSSTVYVCVCLAVCFHKCSLHCVLLPVRYLSKNCPVVILQEWCIFWEPTEKLLVERQHTIETKPLYIKIKFWNYYLKSLIETNVFIKNNGIDLTFLGDVKEL